MNAGLSFYAHTFKGRRDYNQDAFETLKIKEGVYFLSVADGMGGAVGGQIASRLVLDEAKKILKEEFKSKVAPAELKGILERIFLVCQKSISKRTKLQPELEGMGTTLTCMLITGDKYAWGNLGDSRIYLLNSNGFKQLTTDHSYVQDYINNSGNIPSKNIVDKYGNYLMKTLDGGNDEADIFPKDKRFETLHNGEVFLLCSDGLILDKSNASATPFKEFIIASHNLKDASQKLISYAYQNGSTDNITCVLAEYGNLKRIAIKGDNNLKTTRNFKRPKSIVKPANIILFLIVLLVVTLSYFILFQKNKLHKSLNAGLNKILPQRVTNVQQFKQTVDGLLKQNDLASTEKAGQECQKLKNNNEMRAEVAFSLNKIRNWYLINGEEALKKKNYSEAEKIYASALQYFERDSIFKLKLIYSNKKNE